MEPEEAPGTTEDGSTKADSPTQSRPAKRLRTARACDQCRGRKYKCDGNHPSCQPCLNVGLACSYGASPKKRGLPTGYVKILESLWALVFTAIPNSEHAVQRLLKDVDVRQDSEGKLLLTSPLAGSSSILKQRWMSSAVRLEVERLVSSLDKDLDAPAPHTGKREISSYPRFAEEPTLTPTSLAAWDISPDDVIKAPWSGLDGQIHTLPQEDTIPQPLPEDTWRLLEIFFTYTHCWFPIFEKHVVWQTSYSAAEGQFDRSNMAALWAILAYTSRQQARVDPQSPGKELVATTQVMYNRSRDLIIKGDLAPEIADVQALLILSLVEVDRGSWWTAWLLIGQAVRIAILLLNKHNTTDRSNKTEADALHRVLQGGFILDTVVSCRIHQRPHLRSQDISDVEQINEEGSEEWNPWTENIHLVGHRKQEFLAPRGPSRALSIFNMYTGLMKILNDVICNTHSALNTEATYHERSMHLKTWFDNLPKHCLPPSPLSSNTTRSGHSVSPQLLNLHLAYESTSSILNQKTAVAGYSRPISAETSTTSHRSIPELLKVYSKLFGSWTRPSLFEFYNHTSSEKSSRNHGDAPLKGTVRSQSISQNLFPESLPESTSHHKILSDPLSMQSNYIARPSEIASHPLIVSGHDTNDDLQSPLSSGGRVPRESFLNTFPITPITASSIDQLSDTHNLVPGMSNPVSNYDTILPIGTGFMLTDENRLEDPTLTTGLDWTSVSSQFMQNLGFAIDESVLSARSDNQFDLEEWAYGGEVAPHNKE